MNAETQSVIQTLCRGNSLDGPCPFQHYGSPEGTWEETDMSPTVCALYTPPHISCDQDTMKVTFFAVHP